MTWRRLGGLWLAATVLVACGDTGTPPDDDLDDEPLVYTLPVVVHVVHLGELVGTGTTSRPSGSGVRSRS